MSVSEWSGRPDERERADLPSSVAAPGRTPVDRDETAIGDAETLRRDLAAIVDGALDEWQRDDVAGWRQEYVADAVIAAGYRLVSEDDATVTAVGQAIMHALARVAGEDYDSPKAAWSEVGRAAVRALREAGQ